MKHSRTYTHLGIAGALLIPTLAVAAVDIPNVFSGGDPVSASEMNDNFDAMATAMDEIEASVGALEARVEALEGAGLQPRMSIGSVTATAGDVMVVYQARVDGIMSVTPIGNGSETTITSFAVGNDFVSGEIVCDEGVTCTMARERQGGGVAVFVPASYYVALTAKQYTGGARADINWQPLRGPDPDGPRYVTTSAPE